MIKFRIKKTEVIRDNTSSFLFMPQKRVLFWWVDLTDVTISSLVYSDGCIEALKKIDDYKNLKKTVIKTTYQNVY